MNVFPSKIEQWFSITWYRFSLILDLWQKTPEVIHCWKWFIWLSDCWSYFLWAFHQPYQIPWNFFRRKPVSLQSICLITVHLAFRSMKWFWFLFPHWRRQFPWILLRWNTISQNLYQSNSIRLISIRFNWFPWIFFQSKRDPRSFIPCNRFLGNLIHKFLIYSMIFPTMVFFLQYSQSVEKAFRFSQNLNGIFCDFSLLEQIFVASLWMKCISFVSLTTKFNSLVFPWMK